MFNPYVKEFVRLMDRVREQAPLAPRTRPAGTVKSKAKTLAEIIALMTDAELNALGITRNS